MVEMVEMVEVVGMFDSQGEEVGSHLVVICAIVSVTQPHDKAEKQA